MSSPHPPQLPEPPADDVAELLDQLRQARRELRDAERLVHMLSLTAPGEVPDRIGRERLAIERTVANLRVELWSATVAQSMLRATAAGLDVSSQL